MNFSLNLDLQKLPMIRSVILIFIIFLLFFNRLYCQNIANDTIADEKTNNAWHRLVKLVYSDRDPDINKVDIYHELLNRNRGKTIASITIQPLEVFGPTFDDTLRQAQTTIGKFGNALQTKTNPRIIMKNVIVNVGDTVDVEYILENERTIRAFPFIQDVRFLVLQCENDTNMVDIRVITKDIFSFGAGFGLKGIDSGELKLYNHNIWGVGHQISGTVVGNTDKEPYIGWEAYYAIQNIGRNKVNLRTDYYNTYDRKGFIVNFGKEFLYMNTRWGGGMTFTHLDRLNYLVGYDHIVADTTLKYSIFDIWNGYGFRVNKDKPHSPQIVFSARYCDFNFKGQQVSDPIRSYYSNSKLFLGSISISRREYNQDKLIYSYGITEDIPKGFFHEYVFGYEHNEYTNNWYSHLYFSSGNILQNKKGYMFGSFGVGGFFNADAIGNGQMEFSNSYISRLLLLGKFHYRQFIQLRYVSGINRYNEEFIYLKDDNGIRGFRSNQVKGKKKLVLNTETVLFQQPEFLGFNIAFFGFWDMGLIGEEKKSIFRGDFYSGFGLGLRLRNENLVFNTLQLRLSFYPNAPSDFSNFGFSMREIGRSSFYSFQPRKPSPLYYR